MKMGRPAAPALLVFVLMLVPTLVLASADPAIKDLPNRIAAVEALNEQINQAAEKTTKQDWAAALPLLKAIIKAPAFEDLPAERRHLLLRGASGVALKLDDLKIAQTYSKRATAFPNATSVDWWLRFYASFDLGDIPDAAVALTQIAKQAPNELGDIKESNVFFRMFNELKRSPTPQYFDLLEALYAANWKVDGQIEPSYQWRDYALALLERGRKQEAKHVTPRIKRPSVLISMRVDKRFDEIVKSAPDMFNIDKAVDADIADLRGFVLKNPRSMQSVIELTYALLKARRYDEVLSLTDSVVQKANGKSAYDDPDRLIWILNNRAIALGGLGRRDEELELLIRAARHPEHGESNVSQAINLGQFYCDLGRPKDALFTVLDVQNTSPYGRLQVEIVHLCAAVQLGDKHAADSALDYIKAHQADSPKTYESALIDAEDFNGAAALLIQRLNDPSTRSDALLEVQNFSDPTDLPQTAKSLANFRAVVDREEVQKTINKFGRMESFQLRSDFP
jgi:tetratricopeptide (TPR) repeat protein